MPLLIEYKNKNNRIIKRDLSEMPLKLTYQAEDYYCVTPWDINFKAFLPSVCIPFSELKKDDLEFHFAMCLMNLFFVYFQYLSLPCKNTEYNSILYDTKINFLESFLNNDSINTLDSKNKSLYGTLKVLSTPMAYDTTIAFSVYDMLDKHHSIRVNNTVPLIEQQTPMQALISILEQNIREVSFENLKNISAGTNSELNYRFPKVDDTTQKITKCFNTWVNNKSITDLAVVTQIVRYVENEISIDKFEKDDILKSKPVEQTESFISTKLLNL